MRLPLFRASLFMGVSLLAASAVVVLAADEGKLAEPDITVADYKSPPSVELLNLFDPNFKVPPPPSRAHPIPRGGMPPPPPSPSASPSAAAPGTPSPASNNNAKNSKKKKTKSKSKKLSKQGAATTAAGTPPSSTPPSASATGKGAKSQKKKQKQKGSKSNKKKSKKKKSKSKKKKKKRVRNMGNSGAAGNIKAGTPRPPIPRPPPPPQFDEGEVDPAVARRKMHQQQQQQQQQQHRGPHPHHPPPPPFAADPNKGGHGAPPPPPPPRRQGGPPPPPQHAKPPKELSYAERRAQQQKLYAEQKRRYAQLVKFHTDPQNQQQSEPMGPPPSLDELRAMLHKEGLTHPPPFDASAQAGFDLPPETDLFSTPPPRMREYDLPPVKAQPKWKKHNGTRKNRIKQGMVEQMAHFNSLSRQQEVVQAQKAVALEKMRESLINNLQSDKTTQQLRNQIETLLHEEISKMSKEEVAAELEHILKMKKEQQAAASGKPAQGSAQAQPQQQQQQQQPPQAPPAAKP